MTPYFRTKLSPSSHKDWQYHPVTGTIPSWSLPTLKRMKGQNKIQRFQTLSSIAPTNNRSSGSIPYTLRPHLVGVCGCNSTRIFHLLICSTLILHLSTSCLTSIWLSTLNFNLRSAREINTTVLTCSATTYWWPQYAQGVHLQKHDTYPDSWTSIYTPCCCFFENSAYLICQNIWLSALTPWWMLVI
jgi:hypothetical protein